MIDLVASVHGAREGIEVSKIAVHDLNRQTGERAQIRILARQHPHAIAARKQSAHNVASHESIAARYQR
jgi:hypothetical protein